VRVAVFVVSMLVVITPSEASKSCMSTTEARQHFGSVHIYWHGPEHCWDATPTRRHHQIHDVRQKTDQPKWRETMSISPKEEPVPKWREAMSVSPKEEPVKTAVDTEPSPVASRWVDIVQVVPLSVIRKPEPMVAPPPVMREPEPRVAPRGFVIMIIVVTLTLAIVMILEGPISRRNTRSRPIRSA
jgi:hypothetical protein